MDEVYLPTPEEIKALCKKFQDGWTPEERWSRWTYRDAEKSAATTYDFQVIRKIIVVTERVA